MRTNDVAADRVVAVLLIDGWHPIVPGSFSAGTLSFAAGQHLGVPGFRFEEADEGSPYRPAVLAGPLDSIVAVRQVASAARRIGDPGHRQAAPTGSRHTRSREFVRAAE